MRLQKYIINENSDFDKALKHWIKEVQKMINISMKKYPNQEEEIKIEPGGKKYVKISKVIKPGSSKSAFAFIDKSTGDIFKPASWKVPAKHARGNLFDGLKGLGSISQHGIISVKYLK